MALLADGLCARSVVVRGETLVVPLTAEQAGHAREALAKEVYARLFRWLVGRVNASTAAVHAHAQQGRKEAVGRVALLDIFGFECFPHNSFEQLLINYANGEDRPWTIGQSVDLLIDCLAYARVIPPSSTTITHDRAAAAAVHPGRVQGGAGGVRRGGRPLGARGLRGSSVMDVCVCLRVACVMVCCVVRLKRESTFHPLEPPPKPTGQRRDPGPAGGADGRDLSPERGGLAAQGVGRRLRVQAVGSTRRPPRAGARVRGWVGLTVD